MNKSIVLTEILDSNIRDNDVTNGGVIRIETYYWGIYYYQDDKKRYWFQTPMFRSSGCIKEYLIQMYPDRQLLIR